MGKGTGIEWCDDTVNPVSGCQGCELWTVIDKTTVPPRGAGACYAGNLHENRLAKSLPGLYASNFLEVRTIAGRMRKAVGAADLWGAERPEKPWLDGYPRLIFTGDLGDIFSKAVPFEFLADEVIAAALSPRGRHHALLLLTKQPGRAATFARWLKDERGIEWPANVWTGTSITSRASLRRIDALCHVPGRRFLSVEPLIENVTEGLQKYLPAGRANWQCQKCRAFLQALGSCPFCGAREEYLSGSHAANRPYMENRFTGWRNEQPIDWMIVGGESSQWGRTGRPFDTEWARGLRDLCSSAGVPFFLKQLGSQPYEWERCGLAPGSIPSSAIDAHLGIGGSEPDDEQRWLRLADRHGGDWAEWPEDLRHRAMPRRELFRAA